MQQQHLALSRFAFRNFYLVTLTIICLVSSGATLSLEEIFTSNGYVAGFANLNGDAYTDIFTVNGDGSELKVNLVNASGISKDYRIATLSTSLVARGFAIRSIILSDFGGHALLGVVVLVSDGTRNQYYAHYFEKIGNYVGGVPQEIVEDGHFASFAQQPLLFYYDNESVPDLLSVDASDQTWKVWKGGNDGFLGPTTINLSLPTSDVYSSFFDYDFDEIADVMLVDVQKKTICFYKRINGVISFDTAQKCIYFPEDGVVFGPPVVDDWYVNGGMALLLPYCTASPCDAFSSRMAVWDLQRNDLWQMVIVYGNFEDTSWMMADTSLSTPLIHPPIESLRTADLNADNYPDIVTTVSIENKPTMGIFINECDGHILRFSLKTKSDVPENTVVAPLDFTAIGMPGLLVNSETDIALYIIKDFVYFDYHQLTVVTMSNFCEPGNCPVPKISDDFQTNYTLPFGIPVPGVTLDVTFVKSDMTSVLKRANIISSTNFMALQVPYVVFSWEMSDYLQSVRSSLYYGNHKQLEFNNDDLQTDRQLSGEIIFKVTDNFAFFASDSIQFAGGEGWTTFKILLLVTLTVLTISVVGISVFLAERFLRTRRNTKVASVRFPEKAPPLPSYEEAFRM